MTEERRSRWIRRGRRWTAIAFAALVVYALFGFFVVPWIARSQIVKLCRASLHREATVERIRFNPFTLSAEVLGFAMKDRDGSELFTFDRLFLSFGITGIFRRAWRFRDLELDKPRVIGRILPDGRPSVADLFEPSSPASPETAGKKPLTRILIDRLVLRQGSADFVDETRTPRFVETLSPVDLEVRELTTIPSEGGDHVITISIGDKTRIRWSGRQTLDPLHLDGRIEVIGVPLTRAWDYVAPAHPLEVAGGSLDMAWSYRFGQGADGANVLTIEDGRLALHNLAVRPRGGTESWLIVPSAEARAIRAVWPASEIEVGAVRVNEPYMRAWMDPGQQVNWTRALAVGGAASGAPLAAADGGKPASLPSSTPAAPAAPAAPAGPVPAASPAPRPWTWKIDTAEIVNGSVRMEDRSVTPAVAVALDVLGVRLEKLSSDRTAPVTVRVSARINQGGDAVMQGTIVPDPLDARMDVTVHGLDLVAFKSYAAVPHAELTRGAADVSGKLSVGASAPRVRFEGDASLHRLEIVDPAGGRLLAWDTSRARGIRLTLAPDRVRIGTVDLERAFAKVAIDRDGHLNLSRIGAAGPTATPSTATEAPPPELEAAPLPAPPAPTAATALPTRPAPAVPIDIARIAIHDARIDYTDESLILPFGTDIHSASGAIKDLSTTSAAPARLDIEGRVADTGYVKAAGTLRIADPFVSTDVTVTFRDVSIPKLTPYVAQFAGYAVKDGALDLDVHYRIQGRHLVGDHRVVAKDLVLGEKVPGATSPGLPVRLAIALLKDKDGRIDLEVPIEGTVDSPEFAYRKVLWQAVKAILAHVATAPFRVIGRLFGKDDEDLDLVGFASGRADLLAPEQETLAKLAAELAGKPGLSIEVAGRFDPVADRDSLRRSRLEQQIDAKRGTTESQEAILEALYTEAFSAERLAAARVRFTAPAAPPAPARAPSAPAAFDAAGFYDALRAELLASEPASDDDLADLARARASAIAAALTSAGGLDPSRVKVVDSAPVKRKKRGSDLVASEMTMSAGD